MSVPICSLLINFLQSVVRISLGAERPGQGIHEGISDFLLWNYKEKIVLNAFDISGMLMWRSVDSAHIRI
jgi:hypothetical protein